MMKGLNTTYLEKLFESAESRTYLSSVSKIVPTIGQN